MFVISECDFAMIKHIRAWPIARNNLYFAWTVNVVSPIRNSAMGVPCALIEVDFWITVLERDLELGCVCLWGCVCQSWFRICVNGVLCDILWDEFTVPAISVTDSGQYGSSARMGSSKWVTCLTRLDLKVFL